jgi:mannitol-1-/sugar-/sorbitol-6-phosphatase
MRISRLLLGGAARPGYRTVSGPARIDIGGVRSTVVIALTETSIGQNRAAHRRLSHMPAAVIDCDVVLFDMDGTLVDSTEVVERHWARWASRHQIDVSEILAVSHGRPTIETLRIVAPHLATEDQAARIDADEARDSHGVRAVRGALELVASLPAERWAVVTSANRALAVTRLTAAGFPIPDVLVTVEDVARGKPNPASYLHAARQLLAAADRSVVVEDTPVGVEAGLAAGATVIGVTTTYSTLDHCHYCVADLRAIRGVHDNGSLQLHVS